MNERQKLIDTATKHLNSRIETAFNDLRQMNENIGAHVGDSPTNNLTLNGLERRFKETALQSIVKSADIAFGMEYAVLLKDGAEVYIGAANEAEAIQEAVERGLQPVEAA